MVLLGERLCGVMAEVNILNFFDDVINAFILMGFIESHGKVEIF